MPGEEYPLPEASFELLNKILLAYLKTGADKKSVYYKDAAKTGEIPATVVSGNTKFLTYMGFASTEKRGYSRLTEAGKNYVNMFDWGQLEESKKPLRDLLSSSPMIDRVLAALSMERSIPRENFVSRIAGIIEVPRSSRSNRGINALIDMLVFSGLVKESEDNIELVEYEGVFRTEVVADTGLPRMPQREDHPLEDRALTAAPPAGEWFTGATVKISVEVNNETDPDKLKEVLKVIKDSFRDEEDSS